MIAILLAAALQVPQGPYADAATEALIARARQRHHALDAAVHDYRATVTTKLDTFGRNPNYKTELSEDEIERAIEEIRTTIQKYSK